MLITTKPVVDSLSGNMPQNISINKIEKGNLEGSNVVENEQKQQSKPETLKDKLSQAVDSLNEFLDITYKSSKFVLHEGLDRYYVQLVDKETEEVLKEIPPKKLLDSFYEMQKLLGMIVDEKI